MIENGSRLWNSLGLGIAMLAIGSCISCLHSASTPVAGTVVYPATAWRADATPLASQPIPLTSNIALASTAVAGESTALGVFEPRKTSRAWRYVVLHHTATETGDVETIDENHRARTDSSGKPWLGIGYHFVIGNGQGMADGLVEPTFRWNDQLHGAHAASREHNEYGIGICLVGDFTQHRPTERQIAATRDLVESLVARYDLKPENVVRHQDLTATECPGPLFPFEEVVGRRVEQARILRRASSEAMIR